MTKFIDNIGEVVIRNQNSFWIFPCEYLKNQEYFICSPWFSCLGGKWRLVKEPYSEITVNEDTIYRYTSSDLIFRLWKKVRPSLSEHRYAIELSFKIIDGDEDQLIKCVGEIDPEYGCQLKFPDATNTYFSQNGLVKLFFDIQKEEKYNAAAEMSDEATLDEDDENGENEENSEDVLLHNEDDASSSKDVQNLTTDMKQVFLDEQMRDTVLKVENRIFKAHKELLVARSPVFASMYKLQPDLEKKKTYELIIHKCTPESFEVFLHYVYTGNADTISTSNVCNLYDFADQYQVDDLKEKCIKFMKNNLSVETVCHIIASSLRDGESKLQKVAIAFFSKNIKKIIKTGQWLKYMTENPAQANELLIKALKA